MSPGCSADCSGEAASGDLGRRSGATGAGLDVAISSSLTSLRSSPSEVNSRRSVTVKLSCFFSLIILSFDYVDCSEQFLILDFRAMVSHLLIISAQKQNVPDSFESWDARRTTPPPKVCSRTS